MKIFRLQLFRFTNRRIILINLLSLCLILSVLLSNGSKAYAVTPTRSNLRLAVINNTTGETFSILSRHGNPNQSMKVDVDWENDITVQMSFFDRVGLTQINYNGVFFGTCTKNENGSIFEKTNTSASLFSDSQQFPEPPPPGSTPGSGTEPTHRINVEKTFKPRELSCGSGFNISKGTITISAQTRAYLMGRILRTQASLVVR